MPKSTENTVFVRLVPTPAQQVLRHELENVFSQVGPIKKSNWISSKTSLGNGSKGYGFVKYLSHDDAQAAAKELHNTKVEMQGRKHIVKVELASLEPSTTTSTHTRHDKPTQSVTKDGESTAPNASTPSDSNGMTIEEATLLKKKSRVIVRNLSFYAKEAQIRKVMEREFGKILDVHLPKVQSNLHVGFCFVTFLNPKDAKKAVEAKDGVDIAKRTVKIDWSVPKQLHKQMRQKEAADALKEKEASSKPTKKNKDGDNDDEKRDDDAESQESGSESSSSSSESDSDGESDVDDEATTELQDNTIKEKRTLFLRNLPFDTTRHDLFTLFAKFGHVHSIYLVRDKGTGMLKGTAFVAYSKPTSALKAVQEASLSETPEASSFTSQRNAVTNSEETKRGAWLLLKGRKVLVDFAVDKETASTFDSKEHNAPSADRRNMYLQAEARVESSSVEPNADNANTWDDIPIQDQKKRQSALKDKTTKLQSPIFFINPNRLSFRNMAKQIDELGLQKLLELATKRGIEKGLVGAKDQIAHWRARGEMSTREILAKVQAIEADGGSVVPEWDEKSNIKDFIPSTYIDRDFGSDGKKAAAASRGYGFAEFANHLHALACLRELNNNPAYSKSYAAGGKAADGMKKKGRKGRVGGGDLVGDDGKVKLPRLIVDFVVENKVKAKKQAEKRLAQRLNRTKQHMEKHDMKTDGKETANKKKGRGALQREKKRLKRESGQEETEKREAALKQAVVEARKEAKRKRAEEREMKKKVKRVKPPKKKKKVDNEDVQLESYEQGALKVAKSSTEREERTNSRRLSAADKRWFE